MRIITYCSKNYYPVLKLFIKSWQGDITVYSDDKLPVDCEVVRLFDKSDDWHINTERKILSVIEHLKRNEDFVYIDSDCWIKAPFNEVWELNKHDIIFNRVIHRKDRIRGEKEANSGVFFIRANDRTRLFAKEWIELAIEYYKDERLRKYHEQTAFSHLCLDAFDGLKPYTAGVISERVYNLEHDLKSEWLKLKRKYKSKVLHFKNGWWQDKELMAKK